MINDSENSVDFNEAEFEFPPAVRFDEIASASAKPVQPIPTGGFAVWIQRAHYAGQMFTARTKAFALALVGGLAIGALGHTVLVNEASSSPDAAPGVQELNAETTAAQSATKDAGKATGLNYEVPAAQASAMALQSAGQTSSKTRHLRVRLPVRRGQRAYRVAVIR